MAHISYPFGDAPGQLRAGESEVIAQIVSNFTAITAQVNGGLDSSNLAASAVGTTQIADSAVTAVKIADGTVTLTEIATGTTGLAGECFSAYQNSAQSGIVTATFTKVLFQAEDWDISSRFASSRYTPGTPGIYRFSANVAASTSLTEGTRLNLALYKNGSEAKRLGITFAAGSNDTAVGGSALMNANGTTDYFEIFVEHNLGSNVALVADSKFTRFDGELVGKATI